MNTPRIAALAGLVLLNYPSFSHMITQEYVEQFEDQSRSETEDMAS